MLGVLLNVGPTGIANSPVVSDVNRSKGKLVSRAPKYFPRGVPNKASAADFDYASDGAFAKATNLSRVLCGWIGTTR